MEVVVILLSLELHRETFRNAGRLFEAMAAVDERTRWFERAEQSVLEINAPGKNVFRSSAPNAEQERLQQAQRAFAAVLATGRQYALQTGVFEKRVNAMAAAAGEVFDALGPGNQADAGSPVEPRNLARALQAMSRMDDEETHAMREIALLREHVSAGQKNLVEEYEADLQGRIIYERYIIAVFVVLLFGILWFGYRLQRTHQALEAERRHVEEERRERLAAIGELCSSVAHGIRNPLAAIRSSAQLTLELGQLDNTSRDRLQDILCEGARLGDRVTGLLNLSRANRANFQTLDIKELVVNAAMGLKPELDRLGLRLDMAEGEPLSVRGDRRQLEQLVIELVSNAMEHSPPGGAIRVGCRRPELNGMAEIRVEDAGPGIPNELRARIFDLFFTTKPSGTGIGLATVKRIARLHNGDVLLEACEPCGARFVVSIPTVEATDGSSGNLQPRDS